MRKRWLLRIALFAVTPLMLALPAWSAAQAKPVSPSAGTPASVQALRTQGREQCIQPPRHFDLKTLSDAQLALYGLPGRAVLDSNPRYWSRVLAHYHHRSCGRGPALPAALKHRLKSPRIEVTGYAGNWAGNWAYGARGTYRQAYVTFEVPWVTGVQDSLVGFWAGVGGQTFQTSPTGLVQAGVGTEVEYRSNGSLYLYNYAWYETVIGSCCNPVSMPLAVYPYDTIDVAVSSNYQNDGYDYFDICNETTGYCTNPVYIYGDFSDSATGECIGEEPAPGANFGTEALNWCDIVNNSGTENNIGGWQHNYGYIVNGANQTLVDTGPIYNNGEEFNLNYCSTPGSGDFCG